MGINRTAETCFFCYQKIPIQDGEDSMMNHYHMDHVDEMETVRVSNTMKDCVRTICKLCDHAYPLSRLRMHVREKHSVTISEYKQKYGIASDKDYDLVEKVLHKCGLCGHLILLESDVIAAHAKKHKISHAEYNSRFMFRVQDDSSSVAAKRTSQKRKSSEYHETRSENHNIDNTVIVPFSPSMLMSTTDLNLELFSPVFNEATEEVEEKDPLNLDDFIVESEEIIDSPVEKNTNNIIKVGLSDEELNPVAKKPRRSSSRNFKESLKNKLSKLKPNDSSESYSSNSSVPTLQLGDPGEVHNLMDKIMGHFASGSSSGSCGEEKLVEENVVNVIGFDAMISNIWDEC